MKKHFFALLKVELLSLFNINKALKSKDKKEKKKLIGLIVLISFVGVIGIGISLLYSLAFGMLFVEMGEELDAMPALMFTIGSLFVLFSTIHSTNGVIFGFKDYDMLVSMPISPWVVVLAKTVYVYIVNLAVLVLLTLPSAAVYAVLASKDVIFALRYLLILPFLPMLPMTIGLILGTIISVVSARFKVSTIINVLFYALAFAAYMVVMTTLESDQAMIGMLGAVVSFYPVNTVYISGVCLGNILPYLGLLLGSLALFVTFVFVLGKCFCKINLIIFSKARKTVKSVKVKKQSGELSALIKKEIKRFFSSVNVALNCLGGTVMYIVITVIIVINNPAKMLAEVGTQELLGVTLKEMLNGVIPLISVFFMGMSTYCAASVSLEGKQLWIVKSLPINVKNYYAAKILANFIINGIISVLCSVVIALAFELSIFSVVFSAVLVVAYSFLSSLFGLWLNIKFPVFDWKNEAEVVKQGTAMSIQSIVGIFAVIPFVMLEGLFLFVNMYLGLTVILIIICILVALLWRSISTKGVKAFDNF